MKTKLKKKKIETKIFKKEFFQSSLLNVILKEHSLKIFFQMKKRKRKSTHLPFNAATPTVLRAVDMLATNVHC